jgi:ketosteroid isomerase-like protein
MKYLFTILILLIGPNTIKAQDSVKVNKNKILKLRSESNLAIKNHQIDIVLEYLTEEINIAASNGKIFSGKIAFKDALNNIFSENPDLYFVRNSEEVLLNKDNNIAWEKGTWTALRPKTDNWNNYGGNYSAYWVKINGIWKIRAELFVRIN